jgi:hypothetical protein
MFNIVKANETRVNVGTEQNLAFEELFQVFLNRSCQKYLVA